MSGATIFLRGLHACVCLASSQNAEVQLEHGEEEHVPVKPTRELSAESLLLSQKLSDRLTGHPSMCSAIPLKT